MKKVITFLLALAAALLAGCAAPPEERAPVPDAPVVAIIPAAEPMVMIAQVPAEDIPAADAEPCPVSDQEIVMLAKVVYQESNVLLWRGDRYGVSYHARQAAVAWCALNRYDEGSFGESLADVLTAPRQFDYREDAEYTNDNLYIARDVVERWWAEKRGEADVGRTLPADYLFFHGDGKENHFRKELSDTGEYWDWSLPDPYV